MVADDVPFLSWKNIFNQLKLILLNKKKETQRKKNHQRFFILCGFVLERKEEILSNDKKHEGLQELFGHLVPLLYSSLIVYLDEGYYQSFVYKRTSSLIIEFCLTQLKKSKVPQPFTQLELIQLFGHFVDLFKYISNDDIEKLEPPKDIQLQEELEKVQIKIDKDPRDNKVSIGDLKSMLKESIVSNASEEQSEWKSEVTDHIVFTLKSLNCQQIFLNYLAALPTINLLATLYDDQTSFKEIASSSAYQLSEELVVVKETLNLSVFRSIGHECVNKIGDIVNMCLKASLCLASGYYIINSEEATLPSGIVTSCEEYCRKFGWKSSETCLSILEQVISLFAESACLPKHVSLNLQARSVMLIFNGLKRPISSATEIDSTEMIVQSKWKWFEGFNIMLVTMTSRLIPLLSTFIDDLNLDNNAQSTIKATDFSDLMIESSSENRFKVMMDNVEIPYLMFQLFFAAYYKGIKLSSMKKSPSLSTLKSSTKLPKKEDSESESSLEEGSMLGSFFVQTIADSETSIVPDEDYKDSEDPFIQSGEIFLLLSNSLQHFIGKLYQGCVAHGYNEHVLNGLLKSNHLQQMCQLLLEEQCKEESINESKDNDSGTKEKDSSSVKSCIPELCFHVSKLLGRAVTDNLLLGKNLDYLKELLHLQVNDGCFPFKISRYILHVFAKICLNDLLASENSPSYVSQCWKNYLDGLLNAFKQSESTQYSNVEYVQLMVFLFQILPEHQREEIYIQCAQAIVSSQPHLDEILKESPIHFSRLILLLEHLLFHYSDTSLEALWQQVQANVLSFQSPDDPKSKILYEPTLNYEETLLMTQKSDTTVATGNSRLFFNLVSRLYTVDLDVKGVDLLKTKFDYSTWYMKYFEVISKCLSMIVNSNSCKSILPILATRNIFLRMWKLLEYLPAPIQFIETSINKFEKDASYIDYLIYLHWIPKFIEAKYFDDFCEKTKIIFPPNTSKEDEKKMMLSIKESLPSVQPDDIIKFIIKLIQKINEILVSKPETFSQFSICDALLMFGWMLLKRYVWEKKGDITDANTMKVLLQEMIKLLSTSVVISKTYIIDISTQGDDIDEKTRQFFFDVIGVDLPDPLEDKEEEKQTKGLPKKIEDAIKVWNSLGVDQSLALVPSLYKGILKEVQDESLLIPAMIGSSVDQIFTSHTNLVHFSEPYYVEACSMKRIIRSAADICEELVPWIQSNFSEEFNACKNEGREVFSSLWIDVTASHIVNHMEMLTLICLHNPDQTKLERIVFDKMLVIIDKWMNDGLTNPEVVNETILVNWLHFMHRLVTHTKTVSIFISFCEEKPDLLVRIVQSITNPVFSEKYLKTVVNLSLKIFELGKENVNNVSVLLPIYLQVLNKEESLTELITKIISTGHDGYKLIGLLASAIKEENKLERFLAALIESCRYILTQVEDDMKSVCNHDFVQIFETASAVATLYGVTGHMKLFESILGWISKNKVALEVKCGVPSRMGEVYSNVCMALFMYLCNVFYAISEVSGDGQEAMETINKDSIDVTPQTKVLETMISDDDDSDDDIGQNVCTFAVTQKDFMNQHWYHCHTCNMNDGVGCCTVCAKVCHKDHDVTYAKHGSFFCDCGAKEDGSCKAMSQQTGHPSSISLASKSSSMLGISPFAAWGEATKITSKKQNTDVPTQQSSASPLGSKDEKAVLKQLFKDSKERFVEMLKSSDIIDCILSFLTTTTCIFTNEKERQYYKFKEQKQTLKEELTKIYACDKEVVEEKLLTPVLASSSNAFEGVKVNFSGDQGQILRQLMLSHAIQQKSLCLIATPTSKKKYFAVAHDKGKVSILSLTNLLKEQNKQKKLVVSKVTSVVMPFTIINMSSNPANEDYLAVVGLKDCHVLSLNHSVPGRLAISIPVSSLTGNFVIKAVWLPNSQTILALVTADYVKIFDLMKSEKEVIFDFILPSGKISDATFIQNSSETYLLVMSSQGHIYREVLNESTKSSPFYMMNVLSINQHATIDGDQGIVNGGGTSIYYSPLIKMIFFSYGKGNTFAGVLDDKVSEFTKIFPINTSIISTSPLTMWSEVAGQLGLIYAIQQNTNNVVVLAIKSEKIMIHDIKSPPKSGKIQSAICYHLAAGVTDKSSADKTISLLVLHEDGGLKYYEFSNYDFIKIQTRKPLLVRDLNDIVNLKPNNGPTISHAPLKKKTKFPIDFFEHCTVANDIEFGGNDVLQVYTVNQVKTRLNSNGMYIASTKPSGFKLEMKNLNSSNVMVGIRVQLGVQSVEPCPQYIEVHGRIIKSSMAKNRWFDIPFTREESISTIESNKLTVTFGPSSDPYGLCMVNSVKIYVKSKEAFGHNDQDADIYTPRLPAKHQDSHQTSPDIFKSFNVTSKFTKFSSLSEKLLACLIASVNKLVQLQQFNLSQQSNETLMQITTDLLKSELYSIHQSGSISIGVNSLMQNLSTSSKTFNIKKDELHIQFLLELFNQELEGTTGGDHFDVDIFELILSIGEMIGLARPDNFVRFLNAHGSIDTFVDSILQVFWDVNTSAHNNNVSNTCDTDRFARITEMMTGMYFAIMLEEKNFVKKITDIIVDLLLAKEQHISFAAKRGLLKALQSQQSIADYSSNESKGGIEKQNQENAQSTESVATLPGDKNTDQADVVDGTGDATIVESNQLNDVNTNGMTEDESDNAINNAEIQMLLNNDNAMMEIALALSLQNQDVNQSNGNNEIIDLPGDDDVDEDANDDEDDGDDVDDDDDDDGEENIDDGEFEDEEINTENGTELIVEDIEDEASDIQQESFADSPNFMETPISTDISNRAFAELWPKLLKIFKNKLPSLMELNGLQIIPFLQVLLVLCSNLSESNEDKSILREVVVSCIEPLSIHSATEDGDVGKRTNKSEIQLVFMRFLSVLMSRSNAYRQRMSTKDAATNSQSNDSNSFDVYVAEMLAEMGIIDYCLVVLKILLPYWQATHDMVSENASNDNSNNLLKVRPTQPTPDMMPFFMDQYVKSHAVDLFESFVQLVSEMTLRAPYQIHKLINGSLIEEHFNKDWTYILCEYMMIPQNPFIRRQVRKLLLALCGSKEKYRYVKDLHNLRSRLIHIQELLQQSGITLDESPARVISLPYESIVSLTENVSGCIEVASVRSENWQSFCKKERAILPFLIQASYQLPEHISNKLIELIRLALLPPAVGKKGEKHEKKDKNLSGELIQHTYLRCYGQVLITFIKTFLLQSNSTQLRWKAHELIHAMFLNISEEQKISFVELLWCLWPDIASYGHRVSQFVDLVGFFTIKIGESGTNMPKLKEYATTVIEMLKEGNVTLKNHHNASLYRKLQKYLQIDGFYLESDPCVICNYPEEKFNNVKLSNMKSDMRYTTKAQLIKLSTNFTISKINLKISDIKRAKSVKVINVMYNNKPVPSVVELKKTGIWRKAKRITLTQGQTDAKIEFTFPITACNLMIEFEEFYHVTQFSSETLHCPRCSATVASHPGICSNCGENVFQCHKCRAINYDERDPFLCTSCGFCKYAKFEFVLCCHPCCSVESVNNEEDRQKALKSVNTGLEKADLFFQQLSAHRQVLEILVASARDTEKKSKKVDTESGGGSSWSVSQLAAASSSAASAGSSAIAIASINQEIQGIAQRYCVDCKSAFEEMSKITQSVLETRKELAQYDLKQQDILSQAMQQSPGLSRSTSVATDQESSDTILDSSLIQIASTYQSKGVLLSKCYGCALSTVHHCLTILRAFSTFADLHECLLSEGLLQDLIEYNLQQPKSEIITLAQALLIKLTAKNVKANAELNRIICERIKLSLTTQASNMVSEISLSSELSLLKESIACADELWEQRFKCVVKLFLESLSHKTVEALETVTLPCLEIISSCVNNNQENKKVITMNKNNASKAVAPVMSAQWIHNNPAASFKAWSNNTSIDHKQSNVFYLQRKYFSIWKSKVHRKMKQNNDTSFPIGGWLKSLIFSSSRATRQIICALLEYLVQSKEKKKVIVHLMISYLDELHSSGEKAAEYLSLMKSMMSPHTAKLNMCSSGILDKICTLLIKEVEHLTRLENSTLSFDLSQGYALYSLADLLRTFLQNDKLMALYCGKFVTEVLQCYLALRKLVVQRTKLVDEAQEMLLNLLYLLTSGTEDSSFMKACIEALKKCPVNDIRTPVFIFEQLCNIIHKETDTRSEFFMLLEKDPQQEDYLQGRMQGNPYSSKEDGLGPLMRDIKNKICTECELVALLEDDTGMELLVNNQIISLDLPVDQVYKKIWCNGKSESKEPMKIIYRMRGLLGDATEDMIENLDLDKAKDIDEEMEYKKAGIMNQVNGLDVVLKRLSYIRDLSHSQQLVSVILKLLEYCVKVKSNRQYLNNSTSNAMKYMLATLNVALRLERDHGSNSGGAVIAERVLKIMEILLQDASSDQTSSQPGVLIPGEESQLEMLLNHITSPYVRSNPNMLQAMMRLTPFLTFGNEDTMDKLVDHFMPYLHFDKFDEEKSADTQLHLECFCMIAEAITSSKSGLKLKDFIIEKGVIETALTYLHSHTPSKSFRASGILDSAKWKEFLAKPSLPHILKLLRGLIDKHEGTQVILSEDENIRLLHHLEQVSSEEMVGSLAEALMEALKEHPDGKNKVADVRRKTRNEKKMLAMSMRQMQLESLGMMVTSTGHIKAKPNAVIKEIEELGEEKDQRLVCCVCREGYKFYPNKVIGIYTYTTRCVLDEFENKPRRTQGYTTVSHFNVIHIDCHVEAVRHARSRDEWESAALQNGNMKCNGIMPIWGPKVSESSFASSLARHNGYIQECTGFREPTFHSTVHDIRLILLKFANQQSFSKETGGGGRQSNMYLLSFMIHIALYVLNTTRQRLSEEQLLKSFLDAPKETWIGSSYEVTGPLFSTVLSIFAMSLEEWKTKRIVFLKRLLLMAHVRNLSSYPMNRLTNNNVADYGVYKPTLMFFCLIDELQNKCKSKLLTEEEWPFAMSTNFRNNGDILLKNSDKILKNLDEDYLPCESLTEIFDAAGVLADIPDPHACMKEILACYIDDDKSEIFC